MRSRALLALGLLFLIIVDLRGTAFGLFNLVTGLALLAASVIAGGLWSIAGPETTFYAGAGFAVVALLGLAAGGGSKK